MYEGRTAMDPEASQTDEDTEVLGAGVFCLTLGAFGPRALHVVRVRGRESLSRPYVWDVTFSTADPAFGPPPVLGQAARLVIAPLAEVPREVLGVVARLTACAGTEHGRHTYRARLVPRLGRLARRRTSRVFEGRTVPEIVAAVLDSSRIAHRWETRADYPRRAYCAQYDETDLAFVTRLCADVGIWFRFDSPESNAGEAVEIVTFGDSGAVPDVEGGGRLLYRPSHGGALAAQDDHVTAFEIRREVTPTRMVVHGYDFRRPSLPLEARAALDSCGGELAGDVYEHHTADDDALHAEQDHGPALRARLAAGGSSARGSSLCLRLSPGRRFVLTGHEGADVAHVTTEIRHEGRAVRVAGEAHLYENRFQCVTEAVGLMPKRRGRKVRAVLETAVVVGPDGSEIHTDEHGRVRVRFHWQQDDIRGAGGACWARVAEAWAGASWGSQWIPRVGMEVLVSFLAGDASRPVVLGCLRNALHPAPFTLPREKETSGLRSRSTPGGEGYNEIAFTDTKGAEVVSLRAERDFTRLAQHDTMEATGNDAAVLVGRDRAVQVQRNDALTVGERLSIEVAGSARQEMTEDTIAHATGGGAGFVLAGGDATLQTRGDISLSAGGNVAIDAAGDITIKAGGTLTIEVGGAVVVVGATLSADAAGAVVIKGATIDLNP